MRVMNGGEVSGTVRPLVARYGLPVLGSVVLAGGGLSAVSLTQGHAEPAVNAGSVALYALMIVAYALVAYAVRSRLRRSTPRSDRTIEVAAEALLVGCIASPALVLAGASYSCYVLSGCS